MPEHESVIDVGKASNFTGGLEFSNLTYTVVKDKLPLGVNLLEQISGYAPKGCVTAVLGPCGAGKSTFLDALAGRIPIYNLHGTLSLDGRETSPSLIKSTSAYIMKDDRLFPMLTVYETLMFAADFRLGFVSREDKKQRVEKLIQQIQTCVGGAAHDIALGPKFSNSYISETLILIHRNFTNIRRTPELFLSRQMVLTAMGLMMATMFWKPKPDPQGITDRLSFLIFTVSLFFFSSNDAVPTYIQEHFIFIRETSHNAYRASSYVISGLITYLPFLLLQSATYAVIVWFALTLHGSFLYFLLVLFISLLSTNSFVVFVSSVMPNFRVGYAAVIAFTALFLLFCGYFISRDDIPHGWRWMNVISTMKYPYEGLLMNEFVLDRVFANGTLTGVVTGENILKQLDISVEKGEKWKMVYWMLGWAVFYRALFYFVLRFYSNNLRMEILAD